MNEYERDGLPAKKAKSLSISPNDHDNETLVKVMLFVKYTTQIDTFFFLHTHFTQAYTFF